MLPAAYKFKARNDCGVTATVDVSWRPFKVGAGGALSYASAVAPIVAASVANGSFTLSSAIDNTSALNHGGHAVFTVNPGSTPSGNKALYLYLVQSDGTTYGDEERQIGSIGVTASGAISATFEVAI